MAVVSILRAIGKLKSNLAGKTTTVAFPVRYFQLCNFWRERQRLPKVPAPLTNMCGSCGRWRRPKTRCGRVMSQWLAMSRWVAMSQWVAMSRWVASYLAQLSIAIPSVTAKLNYDPR